SVPADAARPSVRRSHLALHPAQGSSHRDRDQGARSGLASRSGTEGGRGPATERHVYASTRGPARSGAGQSPRARPQPHRPSVAALRPGLAVERGLPDGSRAAAPGAARARRSRTGPDALPRSHPGVADARPIARHADRALAHAAEVAGRNARGAGREPRRTREDRGRPAPGPPGAARLPEPGAAASLHHRGLRSAALPRVLHRVAAGRGARTRYGVAQVRTADRMARPYAVRLHRTTFRRRRLECAHRRAPVHGGAQGAAGRSPSRPRRRRTRRPRATRAGTVPRRQRVQRGTPADPALATARRPAGAGLPVQDHRRLLAIDRRAVMTTSFGPYRGDGTTPGGAATGSRGERGRYLADSQLVAAVNTALIVEQPLLVTGEPGTGKTALAWSVATELGLGHVLNFHTRSDHQARDTLYEIDHLLRFYHAQVHDDRATNPEHYVRWNALGEAIRSTSRRLVLIDEIDKAPRDFPNDLLNELDQMEFRVPELAIE